MYKLEMMSVLSQQGSEGVQRYQNSHFKFLPISVELGSSNISFFFSKFKIVQIILGGGGQENYGLFPQFVTFFYGSPKIAFLSSALDLPLKKCVYVCLQLCMYVFQQFLQVLLLVEILASGSVLFRTLSPTMQELAKQCHTQILKLC